MVLFLLPLMVLDNFRERCLSLVRKALYGGSLSSRSEERIIKEVKIKAHMVNEMIGKIRQLEKAGEERDTARIQGGLCNTRTSML